MSADQKLERFRSRTEAELARILGREDTLLFQAMRYAVLGGGKRFRPLIALAAADACGGASGVRAALPFAAAAELIHAYSLVHDDLPCMDDDDTRRGRPSCHKTFGEDVALLAGDGLLTLAFEVMAAAPAVPPARRVRLIGEMARLAGLDGMIAGQLLDITFSPEGATPEGVFQLMLRKTGALITAAARAGAVAAGASAARLETVTLYAENVGLAFQVRDDLHDAAAAAGRPRRPAPFSLRFRVRAQAEPNYALLFGREKALALLTRLVEGARSSLDLARLRSPALRRLAEMLLE
jgi:geranylgeranyl diphosphate synthase type II